MPTCLALSLTALLLPMAAPGDTIVTGSDDIAGGVDNPVPFALEYRTGTGAAAHGRWYIRAQGPGTPSFPGRSAFNVIVDGAQANRCRAPSVERVFADGVEP